MTSKIINGHKYDTSKATEIGSWSNGLGYRDFSHCEETLYKSPKGAYFLVGSGGPMSKYSRSIAQNQWEGSSNNFTPLSRGNALDWCESHKVPVQVIEAEFADLIQSA